MRTLETEMETTMAHGPNNLGSYDDIVTTDESGGCSSDGGGSVENLVGTRKISAQLEINQKEECKYCMFHLPPLLPTSYPYVTECCKTR